jgi:hypothetical protein
MARTEQLGAGAPATTTNGVHLWLLVWKAAKAKVAHLTDKGSTLMQRLFAEHARDMEQAFSCLARSEKEALATVLRKVHGQADEALRAAPRRR